MIIVAGKITVDPQHVKDFMRAVAKLEPVVRTEDGCLYYALALDDEKSGHVTVLERWRDEDALNAHLATPPVKAFLDEVSGFVAGMDVSLYEVSAERKMGA